MHTQLDSQGKITMIQANTVMMNQIASDVALQIQDELKQLESEAIIYHTEDPTPANARKIKASLKRVSLVVQRLHKPLKGNFSHDLFQLRQSITLKHFEEIDIKPLEVNDEVIDYIGERIEILSASLEDGYIKRYH